MIRETLSINNSPFYVFHPKNDNTIYGTLSCLQNNKFHLTEIDFGDGDVMIDIGCNIGLVSMVAAHLYPNIKVFSFDASPKAIECVKRGCAANGIINVQSFNVAVGSAQLEDIKFYSNGSDLSCLVQEGLNSSNPVEDCSINMVSIDEIFDSYLLGIDRVKYLKMDIEGGEFSIFEYIYNKRKDILDRIDYLHLEIHGYKEFKPDELKERIVQTFGNRVFFDT